MAANLEDIVKKNYFVKPNEQSQACLSYAMAKNSLTLVKNYEDIAFQDKHKLLKLREQSNPLPEQERGHTLVGRGYREPRQAIDRGDQRPHGRRYREDDQAHRLRGRSDLNLFSLDIELHGSNHVLRGKDGVQVLLRKDVMLQDQLVHSPAGFHRLLGDLGGVLVTDNRVERGHDTDAVVHVGPALLLVGRDAVDASNPQRVEPVHQQRGRLEATLRHYRLHGIQLQLRRLAA